MRVTDENGQTLYDGPIFTKKRITVRGGIVFPHPPMIINTNLEEVEEMLEMIPDQGRMQMFPDDSEAYEKRFVV